VPGELVLYIIACGSRPAGDLAPYIEQMRADGWDTCVIATPSARKFMCAEDLAETSGHVVRSEYKQPDEQDVLPPPDAVIVAPATFNTINKWAAGISDTVALGLLNEALGLGLPIVAVPFPNVALARHPAFRTSIDMLRSWGIRLIFDPERHPLPTPNMGPPAVELFPWSALMTELEDVRRQLRSVPVRPLFEVRANAAGGG
jgi:Flavoprotein